MNTSDNSLKYDILNELFNISVGKAASMLSDIVDETIVLSVPDVKIIDGSGEKNMRAYLPDEMNGTLMVSSITFEKQLSGVANLIFPAHKMKSFIKMCTNEDSADPLADSTFTDLDFDIVKEIGNIVLNCILGEIGNFLHIHLDYTLPEVKVYKRIDFDKDIESTPYKSVLVLYINFTIRQTQIEGAILVDLTMKSTQDLIALLDKFEAGIDE